MNLLIDYTMILHPGEFNFQRPAYEVDIQVEQMNLNIDPKQFSDLLDFIKFHNYSVLYGRMNSPSIDWLNPSLSMIVDRCREYRQMQLQLGLGVTELTSEQKQRMEVSLALFPLFIVCWIRFSKRN